MVCRRGWRAAVRLDNRAAPDLDGQAAVNALSGDTPARGGTESGRSSVGAGRVWASREVAALVEVGGPGRR